MFSQRSDKWWDWSLPTQWQKGAASPRCLGLAPDTSRRHCKARFRHCISTLKPGWKNCVSKWPSDFFFHSLYCWNVTDYVVLNLYTLFMVYVVKYSWNPEVIYLDQSIKIPVCFDMFMLIVYSRAYNSSCHNTGVDIQKLLLVTLLVFKIWLYFTVSAKCLYFP